MDTTEERQPAKISAGARKSGAVHALSHCVTRERSRLRKIICLAPEDSELSLVETSSARRSLTTVALAPLFRC